MSRTKSSRLQHQKRSAFKKYMANASKKAWKRYIKLERR